MKNVILTLLWILSSFSALAQAPHTATLGVLAGEVDESGSNKVTFQVQLFPAAREVVQVLVDVSGITATANKDFVAESKVLTFAPGDMVKYVDILIIDDVEDELLKESFQAIMTPVSSNVILGTSIKEAIIIDDEEVFQIESRSFQEPDEGEKNWVTLSMSRKFTSNEDIDIKLKTIPQSASNPSDYLITKATLIIEKDELTVSFDVPIVGDDIPEAQETFSFEVVTQSKDIMIENPGAPMTIMDNDEGELALRFTSVTETSDDRTNYTYNEIYNTGPIRLELINNSGEKYYMSNSITPKYKFYVPGQMTFPSRPGEFKIEKLTGLKEGERNIENISVHYSLTAKKMRCQMHGPIWMECPWGNMHPLAHEYDIHPDNDQLPGLNIVATNFEAVRESSPEGLVIGKRVVNTTLNLDQNFGSKFTEDLVMQIMRVPKTD